MYRSQGEGFLWAADFQSQRAAFPFMLTSRILSKYQLQRMPGEGPTASQTGLRPSSAFWVMAVCTEVFAEHRCPRRRACSCIPSGHCPSPCHLPSHGRREGGRRGPARACAGAARGARTDGRGLAVGRGGRCVVVAGAQPGTEFLGGKRERGERLLFFCSRLPAFSPEPQSCCSPGLVPLAFYLLQHL